MTPHQATFLDKGDRVEWTLLNQGDTDREYGTIIEVGSKAFSVSWDDNPCQESINHFTNTTRLAHIQPAPHAPPPIAIQWRL